MRLHFGKGFAVNPSQQADEMLPTIFTCDFGNIPRRVRRHTRGNSRSIWQGEETQSSDSEVRGT
jgi:hypothetical protein